MVHLALVDARWETTTSGKISIVRTFLPLGATHLDHINLSQTQGPLAEGLHFERDVGVHQYPRSRGMGEGVGKASTAPSCVFMAWLGRVSPG